MQLLKNIFGRVWAAWGLLTFLFTFLLIWPAAMCASLFRDELEGQRFFIHISRIWMNAWLFLIACPPRITGRKHFQKNKNYVVVFNHNALLDVPLSSPYVPGANKTIAKASFARIPLFGAFYKKGSVLVSRDREESRVRSFEQMKEVLRKGMHMCIYPEGTRNRTGEALGPFYDGAFKLAVDMKKDIIPCVIGGTKKAMPRHKTFYLLPHRLTMKFLPPLPSEKTGVKALKEAVRLAMLEEIRMKGDR